MENTVSSGTSVKDMQFFADFMTATGYTPSAIEQISGVSSHTIVRWIRTGNATLSLVRKVMDALGYIIEFDYKIPDIEQIERKGNIIVGKIYDPFSEKNPNIGFLLRAIARSKVQKKTICAACGLNRNALAEWTKTDDIQTRWLFIIATSFDWELTVRIYPKENAH